MKKHEILQEDLISHKQIIDIAAEYFISGNP